MMSAKFLRFWTPPCQYQINATSLPLDRIWLTPLPSLLTSFMSGPLHRKVARNVTRGNGDCAPRNDAKTSSASAHIQGGPSTQMVGLR